jgi:RIO-like serine/threonine protein kinase
MIILGKGAQGIIYKKNNIVFKKTNYKNNRNIKKEYLCIVEINRRLFEHPYIIKVYNFYDDSYSMEYLEGYKELNLDYINSLTQEQKNSIFNQLYQTINDLHHINYVHGDLRMSENVMYNSNLDRIKLIDFGYSKNLNGTDTKTALDLIRIDYAHLWDLRAKLAIHD